MRINNSVSSAAALNQLRQHQSVFRKVAERLSTGLSINRGADDPSGLAISMGMKSRTGSLRMAVQNIQDNINMLHTSEGALREISDAAVRIRDLCVRGANEAVLTSADRQKMQAEISATIDAINQIAQQSTFNSKNVNCENDNYTEMVNVPANVTVVHSGGGNPAPGDLDYDSFVNTVTGMIKRSMDKVFGMLGMSSLATTPLTIDFTDIDGNGDTLAMGGGGFGNMQIQIDIEDWLSVYDDDVASANLGYGSSYAFTYEQVLAHEMTHAVFMSLGGGGGSTWGQEMLASFVSGETDRRIQGNEAGVLGEVSGAGNLTGDPTGSSDAYAAKGLAAKFITEVHGTSKVREIAQGVIDGVDFEAAVEDALSYWYDDFAAFEEACDAWSEEYINSGDYKSIENGGLGQTVNPPNEVVSNGWHMQIGADNSATDQDTLLTPWSAAGALDYLPYASVETQEQAQESLDSMDRAIGALAQAKALIGIQENVLTHVVDDIMAHIINLEASRSAIQDANIAAELTELTRAQIMNTSTTSALSQSDNLGRIVLDLMKLSF